MSEKELVGDPGLPEGGIKTSPFPQGSDNEEKENIPVIPANAIKGGRETSDRILYVGNLDKAITEEILRQYFQVGGQVSNVKIMIDKNSTHSNYAFVEYYKSHDANVALQTLNGKRIENNVVKINWAFQSQQILTDDNTSNLFVGDLSIDVDDETLCNAFKSFPGFIQGHVMWDMQSGGSRGYGFVSFRVQKQARLAMSSMQCHELNGRPLRINWASKREGHHSYNGNHRGGLGDGHHGMHLLSNNNEGFVSTMMMTPANSLGIPLGAALQRSAQPMAAASSGPRTTVPPPVNSHTVEAIIKRAPLRVTTSYIGNIPHFATDTDLIPLLQNFGFILDFRHCPGKGCCFVKYDTHEQAAVCIVALANFFFQGRNLRTGWGKERTAFIPMAQRQQSLVDLN